MCGNFLSEPRFGLRCDELAGNFKNISNEYLDTFFYAFFYKEGFKRLANLIDQFQAIKEHSHFIFIAGPQDPGLIKIYPR